LISRYFANTISGKKKNLTYLISIQKALLLLLLVVIEVFELLTGYESYLRKRRTSENIVIRYVSFVSLSLVHLNVHILNLKVVDVFSFYLQIFHWFIAPPSRRYFQGRSPRENPTPLPTSDLKELRLYYFVFNIVVNAVPNLT
jgi:hypothetical protein